jgi:hypothetical protein
VLGEFLVLALEEKIFLHGNVTVAGLLRLVVHHFEFLRGVLRNLFASSIILRRVTANDELIGSLYVVVEMRGCLAIDSILVQR